MANPLQPKCIKVLEKEFNAYVINVIGSSKSGHGDIVAGIDGQFYMFEVKWANDKPSELQKQKINDCIDKGCKAYFIKSIEELRRILLGNIPPVKYDLKPVINL